MLADAGLHDILGAMPDAIFVADHTTCQVLYANAAAMMLTGYSEAQLLECTLEDLYPLLYAACQGHPENHARMILSDSFLRLSTGANIPVETQISRGRVAGHDCLICISRDSRQRLAVEQELAQVHELNHKIVQEVPIGIVTFDRDGCITQINQAQVQINRLDVPPESLLGTNLLMTYEAVNNDLAETVTQVLEGTPFERTVENFAIRTGDTIGVKVRGVPLRDPSENIVGGLLLVEDITEQVRIEQQLQRDEVRYRSLVEALPDLLLLVRHDGTYVDVIPSPNIGLYMSPEQFLGKKVDDVIPNSLGSQISKVIERVAQTRQIETVEYQLPSNNTLRDYEARIVPSPDGEILAVIRDVTEQRQDREKLRRERQISDILLDIGHALNSTLDADEVLGLLLEQIRRVVPYEAANVMLVEDGMTRIVRQAGYEALHIAPELLEKVTFDIEKASIMRTLVKTNKVMICADTHEEPEWVTIPGFEWIRSWLGAPIVFQDEVIGIFSLDSKTPGFYNQQYEKTVSLFAQQAATALHNAKLFANIKELEQAKSNMIRMASHDLRSPLMRAQESASLLAEQLEPSLTDRQQRYFSNLEDACTELENIITNMLSLERIEAQRALAQPIAWCNMIRQVASSLAADAEAQRHVLKTLCEADLPVILGDSLQMQRALANLISNAIKYTPPGGLITIHAFMENYENTPHVTVEVRDTGPGILPEQQVQLFKPFYRTQQAVNENIPGLGLGLSIVKAAVEHHNGTVYVHSRPGRGSVFGFRVPV